MSGAAKRGVEIEVLATGHRAQWRELYQAYGEFYRSPITEDALEETWRWLLDPAHPQEGLAALDPSGVMIGLAHFRAFPKPMLGRDAGFLDDLFVNPDQRGLGIGRALIGAVAQVGRQRGWTLIRWITASDNAAAQMLYDQVAERTRWVTYDIRLGAPDSTRDHEDRT